MTFGVYRFLYTSPEVEASMTQRASVEIHSPRSPTVENQTCVPTYSSSQTGSDCKSNSAGYAMKSHQIRLGAPQGVSLGRQIATGIALALPLATGSVQRVLDAHHIHFP